MVTPGWKAWEEIREEARATLQRAADDAPDAAPGELLQLLTEVTATAQALDQIACAGWASWEPAIWSRERDLLVRERIRARGLHVCCAHELCPGNARLVTVGVATLYLCPMHEAGQRALLNQFNPEPNEPRIDEPLLDLEAP